MPPTATTTTTSPASPPAATRARPRPGDPAALTAIDTACRELRLPSIRSRVEDMIRAAEREQLGYARFLAEALLAECDDRDQRRRTRRVHDAAFPRTKRLEDFDHTANDTVDPATIATLATGTWVSSGAPVCLIGDSGTGKSHLLIGLGIAAAEAGHRFRYVLASRLVNELAEADNDRTLSKVIARYGRVDLLWTNFGLLMFETPDHVQPGREKSEEAHRHSRVHRDCLRDALPPNAEAPGSARDLRGSEFRSRRHGVSSSTRRGSTSPSPAPAQPQPSPCGRAGRDGARASRPAGM